MTQRGRAGVQCPAYGVIRSDRKKRRRSEPALLRRARISDAPFGSRSILDRFARCAHALVAT